MQMGRISSKKLMLKYLAIYFIIIQIMSNHIDELLNGNNPQPTFSHQYSNNFCQQDGEQKLKQTEEQLYSLRVNENQLHYCEPLMKLHIQTTNLSKQNKNMKKRQINIIQVSYASRRKYLQMRKGVGIQTNDLSVHISTLLRQSLSEFQIFYRPSPDQLGRINQFKAKGCKNIKSIKKLLKNQQEAKHQSPQNAIKGHEEQKMQSQDSLKKHISQYFEQTDIICKILNSTKMGFGKKILLIKYLGSLGKIIEFPDKLNKWKQFCL